ncbi:MAG: NAD-dependent epimerase/dehydratase family protein, partial [archaeon]
MKQKILVTGSAGFIGFHLSKRLLEEGNTITGIDNYSPYYDIELKKNRTKILKKFSAFKEYVTDISDYASLEKIFEENKFDCVVNLAAQAGVRYSLTNPFIYEKTNNLGFLNILECCKKFNVKNVVYASSSSVYGGNKKLPFSEEDRVDDPVSLYATTKKYNELMAACYSNLYGLNCTGLRFFTVYGAW